MGKPALFLHETEANDACCKKMLANTLKELMNENADEDTVQDLTKKCGISQRFHNHFHDIIWSNGFICEAHITLGENISYENWQDALEALFQYMDDNRNFVLTRIVLSARKCRATCNGKWSVSDGFDFQQIRQWRRAEIKFTLD